MNMKKYILVLTFWVLVVICAQSMAYGQQSYDIRGQWVGKAQGSIFGAEGSVTITHQTGENIQGIVEGGNIFGTAKFSITGKIKGNYIFGDKEGNVFNGYINSDGTIRGMAQAITGEKFNIFLKRPYNQWGMPPTGSW